MSKPIKMYQLRDKRYIVNRLIFTVSWVVVLLVFWLILNLKVTWCAGLTKQECEQKPSQSIWGWLKTMDD